MSLFRVSLSLTAGLLAGVASAKDLTIGVSQEPDTLHPVITTMTVSQSMRNLVMLPIATPNEVWEWTCYLCTSIPSIDNGGAKVVEEGGKKKILVTWEIRPDAVWGDGKPVTGEDMKLAWEIGVTPTVTKGTPEAFDGIEAVEVDAKNPKRFTLKYKEVRYDYNQLNLSFVPIPAHIERPIWEKTKAQTEAYEKNTAYVTDPTNPALYNGPYKVKEIKPASHVLLERNPSYPGKAAAFPSVLFKIIPNTQTLEANLIAGSVDMTGGVGITFDQALAFQKRAKADPTLDKRFRIATHEDLIFEHIDFNLRDPRLAEVEVRRALMHAVDRDKLCQALFEGIQKPAASAYHPLSPYYTTDMPSYAYDPKKAEEILEAAGWKKAKGGIRAKDGKKLSFTIMTTSQNKVRELVQVYLQDAWKKIGVELSIKNQPARVFFGETLRRGEYGEMGMYATTLTSTDDIQLTSFHSGKIPSAANSYGGSNYGAWKNAKVDELLDKAQVELDPKKRAALVKEALKEYGKDLPQLPLYYRAAVAIVPRQLVLDQEGGVQYPVSLQITRWTWDETKAR
jgi:peptide/nickel transport system substrate-binding protein